MHRFLVVIEKADKNFGAYSPDLPGCVATGKTRGEVERNMVEAIQMHVAGLVEDGLPVPESTSSAEIIAIPDVKKAAQGCGERWKLGRHLHRSCLPRD